MANNSPTIRVLCRNLIFSTTTKSSSPQLQWLIGSPFFPQFTVVSTLRCLHHHKPPSLSPDLIKEAEDLRSLIVKGFHIIGALIIAEDGEFERIQKQAIENARKLRDVLFDGENLGDLELIGGVAGFNGGEVKFLASRSGEVKNVVFEERPERFVWESACLVRCEVGFKLRVFVDSDSG